MEEIEKLFNRYISQYGSVDIAEAEFKKDMHEDADMRNLYREWCRMTGSTEKNGFLDYCDEYLDSQNDAWNTLNDYDE